MLELPRSQILDSRMNRARRIPAQHLGMELQCELAPAGPVAALDAPLYAAKLTDLSEQGMGLDVPRLPLGAIHRVHVTIYRASQPVWIGTAERRHHRPSPLRSQSTRLGLELLNGRLDLPRLELEELLTHLALGFDPETRAAEDQQMRVSLPNPWLRAVAELRGYLQRLRRQLDGHVGPSITPYSCAEQLRIQELHLQWTPGLLARRSELDRAAMTLGPETILLARRHAARQLLPALLPMCAARPMSTSAHTDIFAHFDAQLRGASLYARYLAAVDDDLDTADHSQTRRDFLADAIAHCLENLPDEGHHDIVSLSCGRASELSDALQSWACRRSETSRCPRIDIVLSDADANTAAQTCARLSRQVADSPALSGRVTIQNASVHAQYPSGTGGRRVQLMYGAPSMTSTHGAWSPHELRRLCARLAPGGRLLIDRPRTRPASWLATFASSWQQVYADRSHARSLARELQSSPSHELAPVRLQVEIARDARDRCTFMDVQRQMD